MTIEMPKMDFSGASFKSDEELAAYEATQNKGDKYFKPGRYEVVIDKVEFKGRNKNDDTWCDLVLTYKGTGEKTINSLVQVPTRDVKFGPKGTTFPFKNLKDFCLAIGHQVGPKNLDVLKSVFAKPESLVGRPVTIDVGYRKGYVKYVGKRPDGAAFYNLMDRDHNPIRDVDNNPVEFADRDAAFNYAADKNISVDKYVNVLAYSPSSVAQAAGSPAPW